MARIGSLITTTCRYEDKIVFGAGIAGSDLQVTRSGDDVVIALKNADGTLSGDQI